MPDQPNDDRPTRVASHPDYERVLDIGVKNHADDTRTFYLLCESGWTYEFTDDLDVRVYGAPDA